jgi:hypothetical protein
MRASGVARGGAECDDPAVDSEIDIFLGKYDEEIARQASAARRKLRKLFPGSYELVYDNYNALVFAYAPTERASDIICSIALYPRWVTLFFLHGTSLKDPEGLLRGSGKAIRGIRLDDEKTLDDPAVLALLASARAGTRVPFRAPKAITTLVRAVSARKRPRAAPKENKKRSTTR